MKMTATGLTCLFNTFHGMIQLAPQHWGEINRRPQDCHSLRHHTAIDGKWQPIILCDCYFARKWVAAAHTINSSGFFAWTGIAPPFVLGLLSMSLADVQKR
jgi:hypothetical protein